MSCLISWYLFNVLNFNWFLYWSILLHLLHNNFRSIVMLTCILAIKSIQYICKFSTTKPASAGEPNYLATKFMLKSRHSCKHNILWPAAGEHRMNSNACITVTTLQNYVGSIHASFMYEYVAKLLFYPYQYLLIVSTFNKHSPYNKQTLWFGTFPPCILSHILPGKSPWWSLFNMQPSCIH